MTEINTRTRSQSVPAPRYPRMKMTKSISFPRPSSLRREEEIIYFDPVEEEHPDEILSSSESESSEWETDSFDSLESLDSLDPLPQADVEIDIDILNLIRGIQTNCIVDGDEDVLLDETDYSQPSTCDPLDVF